MMGESYKSYINLLKSSNNQPNSSQSSQVPPNLSQIPEPSIHPSSHIQPFLINSHDYSQSNHQPYPFYPCSPYLHPSMGPFGMNAYAPRAPNPSPGSNEQRRESIKSSEVPEMQVPSTQQEPESIAVDDDVDDEGGRQIWTIEDHKCLANSWSVISQDEIHGNQQHSYQFWKRVSEYFNKWNNSSIKRSTSTVKSYYFRVNPSINEFNQFYNQIYNQYPSGWSEDQLRLSAHELYSKVAKKGENGKIAKRHFNLEHMWAILKENPKWKRQGQPEGIDNSSSKRSSSNPETNIDTEDEIRPMGQKKAKELRKGKNKGNEDSFEGKWKIMESNQAEKIKIMKELTQGLNESVKAKQEEVKVKELELLFKDTSSMTSSQLHVHDKVCEMIKEKYNLG